MVSTATGSFAKLKIISGATFRIIGLTKIPKIEFLPLDWIYRSIRIITVCQCNFRSSHGELYVSMTLGLHIRVKPSEHHQ